MSTNVQFDEPDYGARKRFQKQEDSWPTKLVLKLGLAKNKEQVPIILMIVGVIALAIMFFVGFGGSPTSNVSSQPNPDELIGR